MKSTHDCVCLRAIVALVWFTAVSGYTAPLKKPSDLNITPTITSVTFAGDHFVAAGSATALIRGENVTSDFTASITLARSLYPSLGCPWLDLTLDSIQLDLNGLIIQTTPICDKIIGFIGENDDMLCALANELFQGWTLQRALSGEPALVDENGNVVIPAVDPGIVTAAIQEVLNAAVSHLLQSELQAIPPASGAQNATCATLQFELAWFPLSTSDFYGQIHSCSDLPICGYDYHLSCYTAAIPVTLRGERGKGTSLGSVLCALVRENAFSAGSTLADILAVVQARLAP
jgi:hypothetical protein